MLLVTVLWANVLSLQLRCVEHRNVLMSRHEDRQRPCPGRDSSVAERGEEARRRWLMRPLNVGTAAVTDRFIGVLRFEDV